MDKENTVPIMPTFQNACLIETVFNFKIMNNLRLFTQLDLFYKITGGLDVHLIKPYVFLRRVYLKARGYGLKYYQQARENCLPRDPDGQIPI